MGVASRRMYKLTRKGGPRMNYTQSNRNIQRKDSNPAQCILHIPALLPGFTNTQTLPCTTRSHRDAYCLYGNIEVQESDTVCPSCGGRMHVNNHRGVDLRHLSIGPALTSLRFDRKQFYCPHCHISKMQEVPFQAQGHRITLPLYNYTRDLLSKGTYTLKQVAEITGLGKNVVKEIDKKRLQELYTVDGKTLIQPEKPARFLGIDEFKLHDGYRFATHIIDMETGHILWIAHGKKKKVVYDFIDHVGMEWMGSVEAVACDMNSDFQEAFEERCPHIQPVFDYFHIVKNFNEKVVSAIRKDEQERLAKEGNEAAAKALKRTRYILTSKRSTLQVKDKEAREGKVIRKGSSLFGTEDIKRKEGYEAKYDELLRENKLLFTVDLIKEKLSEAYCAEEETVMAECIIDIMDVCKATGNSHLEWFRRLLDKHFEGIIAHATYRNLSTGKIEGINNKIKTLRRQGYGYPDDEYFSLKLFDISRREYVRNELSHKICD